MLVLYHGSQSIVQRPQYGGGKLYNDYGQAFYCTDEIEMAKEWACQMPNQDGFANRYELILDGLTLLDLTRDDYNILNWLAILLENRKFTLKSDIADRGYAYIHDNFFIEYEKFDVIKGFRADDSYFSFANAFLNNEISIQQLSQAMKLGKLGIQYAIKSENAFSKIKYTGYEIAQADLFYNKRESRDTEARANFRQLRTELDLSGKYLIDIIREQWRNDDVSIQ